VAHTPASSLSEPRGFALRGHSQDVITRDNVSVKVDAVLYYKVVDPMRAVLEVENFMYATSQVALTTLRSTIGQAELDELLTERDKVNHRR